MSDNYRSTYLILFIATFFYLISIPPLSISPLYFASLSLVFFNFFKHKNFNIKFLFLFFLINYSISLSWISQSFFTGGYAYTILGLFMVLFLSAFLAFLNILIIWVISYFIKTLPIKIILIPLSLVLVEITKEFLFGGFPWNPAAIIWVDNIFMLNFTKYIGVYGLSIVIHLTISLIIFLIIYKKKIQLYICIFTILVLYAASFLISKPQKSFSGDEFNSLSITIIQPNIKETLANKSILDDILTYEDLTTEAIKDYPETNVFIWPEGAINTDLNNKRGLIKRLGQLINNNQKIILGSSALEDSKLYNRLYVINSSGNIEQKYDKQKLVLFGEYIPFINNKISKFLQLGINYSKGKEHKLLNLPNNFTASPMICFESIFDSHQINSDICNSDFIIQLSNDSWFGKKYGPIQHLKNSILRSVEKNMTLVRSTPSGISAISDHNGNILNRLNSEEKGFMNFKIQKKSFQKNCHSKINITIIFLLLLFGIGYLYDWRRR